MPRRLDPVVLAIDIGTSSVRTALFDDNAKLIPRSHASHIYRVRYSADRGAELDPQALLRATQKCLRQTRGLTKSPVNVVGGSGFWHSLLALDRAGKPLTPSSPGPTRAVPRMRHASAPLLMSASSSNEPGACSALPFGRPSCFGFAALGRGFFTAPRAGSLPRNGFSSRFLPSAPAAVPWPVAQASTISRVTIGTQS